MPVSASAGLKPLEEKPPLKLRVAREVKTQRGQPRSTRSLPVAAPQRRVEVEGQRRHPPETDFRRPHDQDTSEFGV